MRRNSSKPINEVATIQQAIYARMEPSEKWEEVLRLRKCAWELKKAFLVEKYPQKDSDDIERELRKIFLYAST